MKPDVLKAYFQYLDLAMVARKANDYDRSFTCLEFAHILGQQDVLCHLQVHFQMLLLGLRTGNWREVVGQLYRLFLTPFGHLFKRLPFGNTGRSNVSAFEPMTLPDELREILMPEDKNK